MVPIFIRLADNLKVCHLARYYFIIITPLLQLNKVYNIKKVEEGRLTLANYLIDNWHIWHTIGTNTIDICDILMWYT